MAIRGMGRAALTMHANTNPSKIFNKRAGVRSLSALPEKSIPPMDMAVASGIFMTRLKTIKNFKLGFSI